MIASAQRLSVASWTWKPDELQALLCHAALGTGAGTVNSFARAMQMCPIEHIEDGTSRLLPLVYRNLVAAAWQGPQLPVLRGVHRHSWSGNQRLCAAAREVVSCFSASGIMAVLLKGLPAAVLHYPDLGSRPFRDIDVLVRPSDVPAASRLLGALGFRGSTGSDFFPGSIASRHAAEFVRTGDGSRIDLHWRVSYDEFTDTSDERFSRSVSFRAPGFAEPLRRTDPTDSLLLTIVHGMRANVVSPVRWVVDSSLLLRYEHADIDWSRLISDADRFRVLSSLRAGLEHLESGGFSELIPHLALQQVRTQRADLIDVASHVSRVARPSLFQRATRILVVDYLQRTAGVRNVRRIAEYPVYVVQKFRSAIRLRMAPNLDGSCSGVRRRRLL